MSDYRIVKYKSLKLFKNDHPLFFENKPSGEKHNVYKGFLITSRYDEYAKKYQSKVWQEDEVGTLIRIHIADSVKSAKNHIDTLVQ